MRVGKSRSMWLTNVEQPPATSERQKWGHFTKNTYPRVSMSQPCWVHYHYFEFFTLLYIINCNTSWLCYRHFSLEKGNSVIICKLFLLVMWKPHGQLWRYFYGTHPILYIFGWFPVNVVRLGSHAILCSQRSLNWQF